MRIDNYVTEDEALGGWWTSLRDKVIKPVGRVVASYYTAGASEVAFKAYEAGEARKKMAKAQAAQMRQLQAAGNMYPPVPYVDPNAAGFQPSYPSAYPPSYPQAYPQAYQQGMPQGVSPGYPTQNVSQAKLPEWAIPVGVGAAVLLVVAAASRR